MPCRLSVVATSAEIDGTRASFFEDMLHYMVQPRTAPIKMQIFGSKFMHTTYDIHNEEILKFMSSLHCFGTCSEGLLTLQ